MRKGTVLSSSRNRGREREKKRVRVSGVPALEMAFMMPVVKNEWDIYKTNRNRRSSECSNPQSCRSRKVSASRGKEKARSNGGQVTFSALLCRVNLD